MTFHTNQKVLTPLGKGTIQGRISESEWIVRLPVNEVTVKALNIAITPHAHTEGLWKFQEKEMK